MSINWWQEQIKSNKLDVFLCRKISFSSCNLISKNGPRSYVQKSHRFRLNTARYACDHKYILPLVERPFRKERHILVGTAKHLKRHFRKFCRNSCKRWISRNIGYLNVQECNNSWLASTCLPREIKIKVDSYAFAKNFQFLPRQFFSKYQKIKLSRKVRALYGIYHWVWLQT